MAGALNTLGGADFVIILSVVEGQWVTVAFQDEEHFHEAYPRLQTNKKHNTLPCQQIVMFWQRAAGKEKVRVY